MNFKVVKVEASHENKTDEATDVKFSKTLSYLLRHGAEAEGLAVKPDGFVRIDDLRKGRLGGYGLDDFRRVVARDEKNRFTLVRRDGYWEIRANQGHSVASVTQLNLRIVSNPDFEIIHGTYFGPWSSIKNQGLSRMGRNHIHFAKGLDSHLGLRKNAQVYIYINYEKAASGGLEFWESTNGVILCKGDRRGTIETKFFDKVIATDGKILFPESC